MLCLSQTTGYAIHALGCLTSNNGRSRLIRDVARVANIPKPYLAKIINQLSREGVVTAKRGYHGGITLSRPPETISLLEIVIALEGPNWIGDCLLGNVECAARGICPTAAAWKSIREQIENVLRSTSLADVIKVNQQKKELLRKSRPVRIRRTASPLPAAKAVEIKSAA